MLMKLTRNFFLNEMQLETTDTLSVKFFFKLGWIKFAQNVLKKNGFFVKQNFKMLDE